MSSFIHGGGTVRRSTPKKKKISSSLPDAWDDNHHPEPHWKGKFRSMEIHFLSKEGGLCLCFPYPKWGVTSDPQEGRPPNSTHSGGSGAPQAGSTIL